MTLTELRVLLPTTLEGEKEIEWLADPTTGLPYLSVRPPSASYHSWLMSLGEGPPPFDGAFFWPIEWRLPLPEPWVVKERVRRELKEFRAGLEAGAIILTPDLGELP